MPAPKKPKPIFEVLFEGPEVYPEKIPFSTLSRALAAIQHLASGREPSLPKEESEETAVRLVGVGRGSAAFQFVGPAPALAISFLREAGRVLNRPEEIGNKDYILRPVEDLSATARALHCSIIVREHGKDQPILARIGPDSYRSISHSLLITGETAISGKIVRVGGATRRKCSLRIPDRYGLLYCRVTDTEVARELGQRLYQDVVVHGTAEWLKTNWRVVHFTIHQVSQPKVTSMAEALEELREAGGKAWDDIDDPEAFLEASEQS
jgi:hypothetical protein